MSALNGTPGSSAGSPSLEGVVAGDAHASLQDINEAHKTIAYCDSELRGEKIKSLSEEAFLVNKKAVALLTLKEFDEVNKICTRARKIIGNDMSDLKALDKIIDVQKRADFQQSEELLKDDGEEVFAADTLAAFKS